jgi:hypothetical protein
MMIYLARPVDKRKSAAEQYTNLAFKLRAAGFKGSCFMPIQAYFLPGDPTSDQDYKDSRSLVIINHDALVACDVMLLEYESGQETWGCSQELYFAWEAKIPVIVVSALSYQDLPKYIKAWVPPIAIAPDLTGAVLMLEGIDIGKGDYPNVE